MITKERAIERKKWFILHSIPALTMNYQTYSNIYVWCINYLKAKPNYNFTPRMMDGLWKEKTCHEICIELVQL